MKNYLMSTVLWFRDKFLSRKLFVVMAVIVAALVGICPWDIASSIVIAYLAVQGIPDAINSIQKNKNIGNKQTNAEIGD